MDFKRRIISCLTALAIAVSAAASQRAWEEIDRYPDTPSIAMLNGDQEDVRVTTRDGYVYVAVRQASNVKIFTILGQLIVQQQLRPGNYRFRLGSRGIYILKAGSLTRRVTI